jgi:hypothetical protein
MAERRALAIRFADQRREELARRGRRVGLTRAETIRQMVDWAQERMPLTEHTKPGKRGQDK